MLKGYLRREGERATDCRNCNNYFNMYSVVLLPFPHGGLSLLFSADVLFDDDFRVIEF